MKRCEQCSCLCALARGTASRCPHYSMLTDALPVGVRDQLTEDELRSLHWLASHGAPTVANVAAIFRKVAAQSAELEAEAGRRASRRVAERRARHKPGSSAAACCRTFGAIGVHEVDCPAVDTGSEHRQ